MANNQPTAKRGGTTEKLNSTTAKGLEKVATEMLAIASGKTWTVTGRSFVGRDGITYVAGDKAPKSNVNVFGWKLASDLFTLADAKALVVKATSNPDYANALADAMTATKSLVTYLNHETRHAVFTALANDPTANVADLIESARPAKVVTAKVATNPLADLLAL